MDKICVICGASFKSPPSAKTVTCSPECRSKRAAIAASRSGRKWNAEAKARRSADINIRAKMAEIQQDGVEAALSIPEGQRGPQNRESKVWELISPAGEHITVTNLLDWARKNYTRFEPPCDDVDAAALRVSSGFKAIASSMRGVPSRGRPASSYKGWGVAKLPEGAGEIPEGSQKGEKL